MDQGTIAFLAGKPVGDTTLTVAVQGGSPLLIHDALYEVEKDRFVDLMAVRAEAGTPTREAVRALLGYLGSERHGHRLAGAHREGRQSAAERFDRHPAPPGPHGRPGLR